VSEDGPSKSARSKLLYACVLIALLQALYENVQSNAPLQQLRSGSSPQLAVEQRLSGMDPLVATAADGGNLAMHFDGFDPAEFHQGLLMSMLYFRAAYALYPHRVLVGPDGRVINSATDLAAASSTLPDDNWLKRHDVRAVMDIHQIAGGGVYQQVRAIP